MNHCLISLFLILTASHLGTCRGDDCGLTAQANSGAMMAAPIKGETILEHEGYSVSYNRATCQPNYVAWVLTEERLSGKAKRTNIYCEDEKLDCIWRSTLENYRSSGFDRGHMCPAGDNKCNQRWMDETFILSNICPQDHSLNEGAWNDLENACRRRVKINHERVYIVCGPLFDSDLRKSGKRISIPSGFFKLLLCLDKGHEKGIAFIYKNLPDSQPLEGAVCSIDSIESITNFDFFHTLNKELQNRLESECCLGAWEFIPKQRGNK